MSKEYDPKYIIELSKSLVDAIELSNVPNETLLFRAVRLARICNRSELLEWLSYEQNGYNSYEQKSLEYLSKTGRWIDKEKNEAFWGSFITISTRIPLAEKKLEISKIESLEGNFVNIALREMSARQNKISFEIVRLTSIKTRIISLIYDFALSIYHEMIFSNIASSTFENYRAKVDALVGKYASAAFSKMSFAVDRLREGDEESISQGLTTCRRIIENIADAICPPTEKIWQNEGNDISLGKTHYLNRINFYINERISSKSQKARLRQNIKNLYDRSCAGVHDSISVQEAHSLFLNVYLFLGEVLTLPTSKIPLELDDKS